MKTEVCPQCCTLIRVNTESYESCLICKGCMSGHIVRLGDILFTCLSVDIGLSLSFIIIMTFDCWVAGGKDADISMTGMIHQKNDVLTVINKSQC